MLLMLLTFLYVVIDVDVVDVVVDVDTRHNRGRAAGTSTARCCTACWYRSCCHTHCSAADEVGGASELGNYLVCKRGQRRKKRK